MQPGVDTKQGQIRSPAYDPTGGGISHLMRPAPWKELFIYQATTGILSPTLLPKPLYPAGKHFDCFSSDLLVLQSSLLSFLHQVWYLVVWTLGKKGQSPEGTQISNTEHSRRFLWFRLVHYSSFEQNTRNWFPVCHLVWMKAQCFEVDHMNGWLKRVT